MMVTGDLIKLEDHKHIFVVIPHDSERRCTICHASELSVYFCYGLIMGGQSNGRSEDVCFGKCRN